MTVQSSRLVIAGTESAETKLFEPGQRVTHVYHGFGGQHAQAANSWDVSCVAVTHLGGSAARVRLGNGTNQSWQLTATDKDELVSDGETIYFSVNQGMYPVIACKSTSSAPAVLAVATCSGHYDSADTVRAEKILERMKEQQAYGAEMLSAAVKASRGITAAGGSSDAWLYQSRVAPRSGPARNHNNKERGFHVSQPKSNR